MRKEVKPGILGCRKEDLVFVVVGKLSTCGGDDESECRRGNVHAIER
jgi:hypothetical protein